MLPLMTDSDLRHLANTSAPISDQERAQAADNIHRLTRECKRLSTQLAELLVGRSHSFDLVEHLKRQMVFSAETFGPGVRTKGVIDHIRKELTEIEENPRDLEEWIDVMLLACDGAWRTGASAEQIVAGLAMKLHKNQSRTWPDWRTANLDQAIQHNHSGETANASA
ncbi:MAG TPA: dATP/dGTP pyrophosphohydrolase domain-containing protein [Variovorax sp.]